MLICIGIELMHRIHWWRRLSLCLRIDLTTAFPMVSSSSNGELMEVAIVFLCEVEVES